MPTKDEQLRRYEEEVGRDAAERQAALAASACSYCGGRDGRHGQLCKPGLRKLARGQQR